VATPALIFTVTRAPIIAVAAVLVPALALRRSSVRAAGGIVAIGLMIVLIATWGRLESTPLYRERVSDTTNISHRAALDRLSLEVAADRPILGWGYGSFDQVKEKLGSQESQLTAAERAYTSHNTFLTVLVELGAVGIAFLLAPWLIIAAAAMGRLRTDSAPWMIVAWVGVVVVYVITAATIDMRFFSVVPALAWIAVGLLRRHMLEKPEAT
jgi:O-antigen ligase